MKLTNDSMGGYIRSYGFLMTRDTVISTSTDSYFRKPDLGKTGTNWSNAGSMLRQRLQTLAQH